MCVPHTHTIRGPSEGELVGEAGSGSLTLAAAEGTVSRLLRREGTMTAHKASLEVASSDSERANSNLIDAHVNGSPPFFEQHVESSSNISFIERDSNEQLSESELRGRGVSA